VAARGGSSRLAGLALRKQLLELSHCRWRVACV
jgi:hypothetical protein